MNSLILKPHLKGDCVVKGPFYFVGAEMNVLYVCTYVCSMTSSSKFKLMHEISPWL